MWSRPRDRAVAEASIDGAIAREVDKLERIRATVRLVAAVALVLLSAVAELVLHVPRLRATLPVLACLIAWSALVLWGLRRRNLPVWQAGASTFLDTTVPAAFLAVFAAMGYASVDESYIPGTLIICCGMQVITLCRMSARESMIVGVVGAGLWTGVAIVAVPQEAPLHALRGAGLAALGVTSAVLAAQLRRAVGGALMTVRAGDLFGKYRVGRVLAEGGMGVVHEATYCPEGGFERPVAMKMIHPHLAAQESFIRDFRNEAELSARLLHDNIVQVLDFGRVDDRWFLAMERIDGMTVRELWRRARAARTPIPQPLVVYLGRSILAALHHAHHEASAADGTPLRVIHRDLAPSNILVSRGGKVKLSDFGIARALGGSAVMVTQNLAGHVGHMAPEQAAGEPLDERCDLFCVGIVLWELLCGRGLFHRSNEAATLLAVSQAEIPPPSSVDPALAAWDRFFERALARPREQRFQTARAVTQALEALGIDAGSPEDLGAFITSLPPVDASLETAATVRERAASMDTVSTTPISASRTDDVRTSG